MELFCIVFLLMVCPTSSASRQALSFDKVETLVTRLSKQGNVDVMVPRRFQGRETWVLFDLAMKKLLSFDQTLGIFRVSAWWRLYWTDANLLYNGTREFGPDWDAGTQYISMAPERVWQPDIISFHSIDIDDEETYRRSWVWIYDETFLAINGYNVFTTKLVVLNAHCSTEANIKKFPFDEHLCTLVVGPWSAASWVHRMASKLHPGEQPPYSQQMRSEEWDVNVHEIQNVTERYVTGLYDEVRVLVKLKRFPHYFLVNIIFPMVLMVTLACLTYWIPINSEVGIERIPVQATLLLTNVATILFTAERRPMLNVNTWMDDFQSSCIFLTFLPLLESCIMVWLKSHFDIHLARVQEQERAMGNVRGSLQGRAETDSCAVDDSQGYSPAAIVKLDARRAQRRSGQVMEFIGRICDVFGISWTLTDADDLWGHCNTILSVVLLAYCFADVGWDLISPFTARSQFLLCVPAFSELIYLSCVMLASSWYCIRGIVRSKAHAGPAERELIAVRSKAHAGPAEHELNAAQSIVPEAVHVEQGFESGTGEDAMDSRAPDEWRILEDPAVLLEPLHFPNLPISMYRPS